MAMAMVGRGLLPVQNVPNRPGPRPRWPHKHPPDAYVAIPARADAICCVLQVDGDVAAGLSPGWGDVASGAAREARLDQDRRRLNPWPYP
jgi:hypothetical protein